MSIKVHKLYYGPVEDKGILLKTSPDLRSGKVLSDDAITDIYTKAGTYNGEIQDSELIYTSNGPVIRVSRIKPLQGHDKRTSQSCNITLLVQLKDISSLLVPLLDEETTFPLKEIRLKVEKEG
jgi:hypothetical protein